MDTVAPGAGHRLAQANRPTLSVVTPCFNEEGNLLLLYDRLRAVLDPLGVAWEWVLVDDRSRDGTWDVICRLAVQDERLRGVRFSRNFGSHTAIACGLERTTGECAAVMAADLQDPPEALPALMEQWRNGAGVVWAVRRSRPGERRSNVLFARAYYWLMRRVADLPDMPPSGADFFLLDRAVIDSIGRFGERNTSLLALLTWMGFRQASILYDKHARVNGRSGWTLAKKIKLVVDSLAGFSFVPIRAMSVAGFATAAFGLMYAAVVAVNALLGAPVEGWSSLMIAVLVIGGFQMVMLGVLGEYLWRSLDEARRRPRYIIEDTAGAPKVTARLFEESLST